MQGIEQFYTEILMEYQEQSVRMTVDRNKYLFMQEIVSKKRNWCVKAADGNIATNECAINNQYKSTLWFESFRLRMCFFLFFHSWQSCYFAFKSFQISFLSTFLSLSRPSTSLYYYYFQTDFLTLFIWYCIRLYVLSMRF